MNDRNGASAEGGAAGSRRRLVTAFLIVSVCGIGGGSGLVWARRIGVDTRRWISDQEFADIVSLCQFMPGPNVVDIAACVGARMRGVPGAVVSAFATFGPPCTIYFAAYRIWDRFRDAPWQRLVRLALVPVVMGLVIASGAVMARAADTSGRAAALTVTTAGIMLATQLNPMWMLVARAALGGFGLL